MFVALLICFENNKGNWACIQNLKSLMMMAMAVIIVIINIISFIMTMITAIAIIIKDVQVEFESGAFERPKAH